MNDYQIRLDYTSGMEVIDIEADTRIKALEAVIKMLKAREKQGTFRSLTGVTFEKVSAKNF